MGRNHEAELEALPTTLHWAAHLDIAKWKEGLAHARRHEAVIVASGGSYCAALLLAQLHTRNTGKIAVAVTPLEFMAMGPLRSTAVWLISAGGNNEDILAAFHAALLKDFAALVVLCGNPHSPLVSRALQIEKAEVLPFPIPTGRDGFLATNSLVALFSLLLRLFDEEAPVFSPSGTLRPLAIPDVEALLARQTIIVLYDGWLKAVAVDLESRFSEAALGHVQLCDYRNFAHGRHYWLARRGDTSGVLALITPGSTGLAHATLNEIPPEIPRHLWSFASDGPEVALEALIHSMFFARAAARRLGVDPGRPGVPEFGRRIYELGPMRKELRGDDAARVLAIERKSGLSVARLKKLGRLPAWEAALTRFREALAETSFAGLVLDYDGTMVATKHRFAPLPVPLSRELKRLLEEGIQVGIATGRGKSVWKELRSAIPQRFWGQIVVGYYNGGVLRPLMEEVSDLASGDLKATIARCRVALEGNDRLREEVTVEARPTQITVTGHACDEDDLWFRISRVLERSGITGTKVVRSSHSVDIVELGTSKRAVVAYVEGRLAPRSGHILKVGDRGRWPGNDAELLDAGFALSVDEVSDDPQAAWNLLGPGLTGAAGAARYLSCLASGRFDLSQLSR